jgi:hypothetical protein
MQYNPAATYWCSLACREMAVNEPWIKCCRKIPAETLYRPVTSATWTNKAERQKRDYLQRFQQLGPKTAATVETAEHRDFKHFFISATHAYIGLTSKLRLPRFLLRKSRKLTKTCFKSYAPICAK